MGETLKSMKSIIKICGITHAADAAVAVEAGADCLGFIFYPKSPRHVTPAAARTIIAAAREINAAIQATGVFVNESLEEMLTIAELVRLNIIQLHGREPGTMAAPLREHGYGVFKAFHISDAKSVAAFDDYDVDGYLCDTPGLGEWGGTGRAFDHRLLADRAERFPVILAGGLTAETVAEAIRRVRPWGVDVASGVEAEPGRKDHAKVRAFIQAARRGFESQ